MSRRDPADWWLWAEFFLGWWIVGIVGVLTGWLFVTGHPVALGLGGLLAAALLHCVVPLTDPEDSAHEE
jgi:hypothetical protein